MYQYLEEQLLWHIFWSFHLLVHGVLDIEPCLLAGAEDRRLLGDAHIGRDKIK